MRAVQILINCLQQCGYGEIEAKELFLAAMAEIVADDSETEDKTLYNLFGRN